VIEVRGDDLLVAVQVISNGTSRCRAARAAASRAGASGRGGRGGCCRCSSGSSRRGIISGVRGCSGCFGFPGCAPGCCTPGGRPRRQDVFRGRRRA
jgi:hypothetical protein